MWKFAIGFGAAIVLIEVAHRRDIKLPFGCGGTCGGKAKPATVTTMAGAQTQPVVAQPNPSFSSIDGGALNTNVAPPAAEQKSAKFIYNTKR